MSPRAFKVLALAQHMGLEHQTCIVDLTKGEQNLPGFAALNPNKRMPVLEDGDFVLWESNAILQYLASKKPDSGLLPLDARQRALVTQWQCWDLAHWDPACATLVFERVVKKVFSMGEPDASEIAKGEERFHRCAEVLDAHLRGRNYIVGNALTVADFSVGAPLNVAVPAQLPLAKYAEIKRWHAGLCELPAWKKTMAPPPGA
jgi:glutathione S-transferase